MANEDNSIDTILHSLDDLDNLSDGDVIVDDYGIVWQKNSDFYIKPGSDLTWDRTAMKLPAKVVLP